MSTFAIFYPTGHEAHAEAGHPERPERVEVIRAAFKKAGYWEGFPKLAPLVLEEAVLGGVHTALYLELLQLSAQSALHLDADTYTTRASWDLALNAAGGGAAVAAAVWDRDHAAGFALTRPPGHHARPDQGMGFCLLNNVAIAAEYLLRARSANRLAIIDIDLHHGNGTQDIFWERGEVFYFSIHQSPLYPGTGSLAETGGGEGVGKTANFPLPPGAGDAAFAAVVEKLILPLLTGFAPEMLLLSVGFDPHWRDPLGHLQLTVNGYAHTVAALADWAERHCQGRIALFLEGGYDLQAAAACSLAAVDALQGRPWQDPLGSAPHAENPDWQKVIVRSQEAWGL